MTPDHNQPGSISPPVGIAVLGTGITRIVSSLPAAAEVLHDHWPKDRRGARWRAAVKACLAAHEGKGSIAALRKALIAAASEADILRKASRPSP